MLERHAAIAPEPEEWSDLVGLPTASLDTADTAGDCLQDPGCCAVSKLHVTIGFGQGRADARQPQREWSSGCHRADSDVRPDDLHVKRYYGVCSTFVHRLGSGAVDNAMEERFARSKYKHFRGAFMQVSFLMPLGALGLALESLPESLWLRVAILSGVVAPLYLIYGIFALKHKSKYLRTSGTTTEKLLLGLLCLQSIAIVWAEWARPRVDYGMMVMHIGFVHNFTPLSEVAMHTVTAAFGLVPYILLKVLLFLDPSVALTARSIESTEAARKLCISTTGKASLLLEILMPFIILLYQMISTMRRDKSMRLDLLSSAQLNAKRKQLNVEKQKCEDLLTSMLPRQIIASLKANEPIEPQLFTDVTVIFVEICDFSRLCLLLQPNVVVEVLNIIYLEFDRLSDLLHVYKVETVAQVYMAVVGCPEPIINHADVAAHFAIAAQTSLTHLRERVATIKMPPEAGPLLEDLEISSGELKGHRKPQEPGTVAAPCIATRRGVDSSMINIRVGLNSGSIRAGVVGWDSPRYKLVGDTVNTASRMESTCEPGKVQVSSMTKERLTKGMFLLEDRGEVPVKGKGTMRTSFLTGYAAGYDQEPRTVLIEQGTCMATQDELGVISSTTAGSPSKRATNRASSSVSECLMERDAGWLDGSATWWKTAINRLNILDSGEGGDTMHNREGSGFRHVSCGDVGAHLSAYSRFELLFLLVPPNSKSPSWIYTLKQDKPKFTEDTIHKRISSARNLTITWLLILAAVSVIDYFMDVLADDLPRYRSAILFRALGNNVVGMVYLLALTSRELFRQYAQRLTIGMLLTQGIALLACGMTIYNSEPAIVAMYGAYVLFYTVCTISQRLILCALSVVGYIVIEVVRCDWIGLLGAGKNIGFLLIFFVCMACGVRLEEHLEHVAHYEHRRVTSKLEEIKQAKAASSQLLTNLLPPHVVDLVGEGVSPIAEHHPVVTIIFTDIKGFTAYSSRITPQELVDLLNSMYSAFDEIIVNWALHKVEVIGDAYFVSAGCPAPSCPEDGADTHHEYAMRAVEVALAMLRTLPRVCDDASVQMRVGLHTGPVVAGVVGKKGPRYHLFGSAVGYAEKMESHGVPGRVQISDATHTLLTEGGHDYEYEERSVEVEGEEGPQRTWLVTKSNSKAAFQIQKQLMVQRRQCVHQARSLS